MSWSEQCSGYGKLDSHTRHEQKVGDDDKEPVFKSPRIIFQVYSLKKSLLLTRKDPDCQVLLEVEPEGVRRGGGGRLVSAIDTTTTMMIVSTNTKTMTTTIINTTVSNFSLAAKQ